jgi:hypothetical protein
MRELEIITRQLQLLHTKSLAGALDLTDIKILESLVRSKLLIGQTPEDAGDENPFSDLAVEDLKRSLAGGSNGQT